MSKDSFYPNPTPIFHITHIRNLPAILKAGGLQSNSLIKKNNVKYVNLAHQNIQDRRETTQVPLHPYGNLHDYVPFYFAPRSPMLFTIKKGNVQGYKEGQGPVIYLKSTVQRAVDASLECVFTDGHAIVSFSEFYDEFDDLKFVDWDVMKATYWNDTPEDNDRRRRRQAEFLAHNFVPWSVFQGIGVLNTKIMEEVQAILDRFGDNKPVRVKSEWYY